MKTVVSLQQVAHLWANKAQWGARTSNGSLFFRDSTIYSYGPHFPIAKFAQGRDGEEYILFTTRRYSVTTARHILTVRRALSRDQMNRVIYCHNPAANSPSDHAANFAEMTCRFNAALEKGMNPRTRNKAEHLELAETIRQQANRYRDLFCDLTECCAIEPTPEYFAALETARCQEAQKRAERERKRRELQAAKIAQWENVELPLWKRGANSYRGADGQEYAIDPPEGHFVNFRLVGDEVETTLGARFPVSHCQRVFRSLQRIVESGKPWRRNGDKIPVGLFQIDSVDPATGIIQAGCHRVRWQEISQFAVELGIVDNIQSLPQ
jgi:hypothetical protein